MADNDDGSTPGTCLSYKLTLYAYGSKELTINKPEDQ